jgi:low temperature requirement protein LtrA
MQASPRWRHPAPDQSWLELFYDLAFVAAIVVFSGALARDWSGPAALWLMLIFAIVWVTWLLNTLFFERVEVHGSLQRSLLVLQMALVLLIAVTAHAMSFRDAFVVGPATAAILVAFVVIRRAAYHAQPELASEFTTTTPRIVLAAVIFGVTGFLDWQWFLGLWLVGVVLLVSTIRFDHPDEPGARPHLVHRFGEFTLIMLGESFVKIGLVAAEEPPDAVDLFGMPLAFVLVASIWWLYFTEIPTEAIPPGSRRRRAWVLLHFPIHLAIVTMAVGLSKMLLFRDDEAITERLVLITVPLVVVLLCLAGLNLVLGGPEPRRRAGILTGGAVVVAAVAAVNGTRDSVEVGGLRLDFQLGTTTLVTVAALLATILLIRRAPRGAPEPR